MEFRKQSDTRTYEEKVMHDFLLTCIDAMDKAKQKIANKDRFGLTGFFARNLRRVRRRRSDYGTESFVKKNLPLFEKFLEEARRRVDL